GLLRAAPGGCPAVAGRLRRLATVLAHEQLLLGQAESPESGSWFSGPPGVRWPHCTSDWDAH
ncbi:hypothetical protein PV318_04725, partial [Streptomyces sp. ME02-6991-2B]|nr:hypothetical protein [Streptomyces sp. ME02-6991-2B]